MAINESKCNSAPHFNISTESLTDGRVRYRHSVVTSSNNIPASATLAKVHHLSP